MDAADEAGQRRLHRGGPYIQILAPGGDAALEPIALQTGELFETS
jgi:hypothetical protein